MNTGLVLSGGGVRGIAHIGAIKALEEQGISPDYIAGTSAGAIVGALYAGGFGWETIFEFFKSIDLFSINKYALNKPGFVDTEKFYEKFTPFFPEDDFDALKIPLYITATDILKGTLKIFHKGELIRPILASAAFPGMFTPVKINGAYYVDGGTLNNFPVDLVRGFCDRIVGVYVNPFDKVEIGDLKHSYNILERAYKIRSTRDSESKFSDCDLLISPQDLSNYSTFSLKDMDTVFKLGYDAAKEALKTMDQSKFS
jgi:NTE family protein